MLEETVCVVKLILENAIYHQNAMLIILDAKAVTMHNMFPWLLVARFAVPVEITVNVSR
jgi:hypothetical protein